MPGHEAQLSGQLGKSLPFLVLGSHFGIIQEHSNPQLVPFWDSLAEVFFHNCCHGGQRRKGTRLKSMPTVFADLEAECQNDHEHLPYQVHMNNWPVVL